MATLSVNLITKDQVKPTLRAIKSLDGLVRSGDEIVVVDTGSTTENLQKFERGLQKFEFTEDEVSINLVLAPWLSKDLGPYIEKWLPEQVGKLEKDGQYANLTGILDFAEARNLALAHSTKEAIFWIDSDDVLVEEVPGRLREIIDAQLGEKFSALFLDYQYSFAQDGTLSTTLKRERVALREQFKWKGKCHETLMPDDGILPIGYCQDLNTHIRHTEARKGPGVSDIRNYVIMRKELEELEKDAYVDPRTLLYLGNACRGLQRWKEAVDLYKRFESQSGSPEDRYAACQYIAQIYLHDQIRRPIDAQDWFQKATEIKKHDPRAYYGLSRCALASYDYRSCVQWYEFARQFPDPTDSLHSYDPNSVHYYPHILAAEALLEVGEVDYAREVISRAVKFRPDYEAAKELAASIDQRVASTKLFSAINYIAQHVKGGPPIAAKLIREQIYPKLFAVPAESERAGLSVIDRDDPRDEAPALAIFCGETPEEWGPRSAETGIGGSEKMVLLIAPVLQELGWNVTVYASVPFAQRGITPDGVRWSHWSQFDNDQDLDVLIAWRGHGHLTRPVSARKRVLWLHDVQNPDQYPAEILECLDLAIFESDFHLEPVKSILPPEKVLVSTNAIVERSFDATKRDPKHVVFFSSPDRGLTTALRMVKAAQSVDPEIRVTVMYGFSPYERKFRVRMDHRSVPDLGRDASIDDYERYVGKMVDETGARMLNRVSFEQVGDILETAGIWVYPTRFPEISCMAAMEAQQAGLVCITSEFGALTETLLEPAKSLGTNLGPVEDTNEYIAAGAQAILDATKIAPADPRRETQSRAAIDRYRVENVAAQWTEALKVKERA